MAAPNLNFYPSPINNSPIPVCFARSSVVIGFIYAFAFAESSREQKNGFLSPGHRKRANQLIPVFDMDMKIK
jgi:hypothetical protein